MTTTDGIVIDGRLMRKGDMSGPKSARMVLQNPLVDTAVFEVARGGILREGLGYDRNDVAVVTNVSGDHLGLHGIDTLSQLAAVKGVIVEAVPALGDRGAQRRRPAGRAHGPPQRGLGHLLLDGDREGRGRLRPVDGHCGRGGAAVVVQRDATTASSWCSATAAGRCRSSTRTSSPPRSRGGRG